MEKKKMGLKNVILVTLLTALIIIIQSIVLLPFMANLKLVILIVSGIDLLLCGPIYVLMVSKSPSKGTLLLFSFIMAIYYFMTNSMIFVSTIIVIAGLLMELVLLKGGYESKAKLTIAYAIYGVGVMLAPILLILLQKDQMVATMLANGLTQEYINTMFSAYSKGNIAVGVVITIVGAILGSGFGYKVLNKYFATSGVLND